MKVKLNYNYVYFVGKRINRHLATQHIIWYCEALISFKSLLQSLLPIIIIIGPYETRNNTKAKGIGKSLSKFLRRDSDNISWGATELIALKESPFFQIGSIIGKRSKGRHVTLQNLYRSLHYLTSDNLLSSLSKEEKLEA